MLPLPLRLLSPGPGEVAGRNVGDLEEIARGDILSFFIVAIDSRRTSDRVGMGLSKRSMSSSSSMLTVTDRRRSGVVMPAFPCGSSPPAQLESVLLPASTCCKVLRLAPALGYPRRSW